MDAINDIAERATDHQPIGYGFEPLPCARQQERKPGNIKNYGIVLRYQCRTGPVNMYKEVRHTSLSGAVNRLIKDMAGRHRAKTNDVQIIKAVTLNQSQMLRKESLTYQKETKFPKVKPGKRTPLRSLRTTFKASRPIIF